MEKYYLDLNVFSLILFTMINILTTPTMIPLTNYLWGSKEESEKGCVYLSHNGSVLKAQFKIEAKELRREVKENNGPVYTDSCCELFLMKKGGEAYYNIEISASGAILIGKGKDKPTRTRLIGDEWWSKVKRNVTVLQNDDNKSVWTVDVELDLKDFDLDSEDLLGNIYLCGDKLKETVFISLFNIDLPSPNFHCKEFFGSFKLC